MKHRQSNFRIKYPKRAKITASTRNDGNEASYGWRAEFYIQFNSLESHLLATDENINGYNIQGAISQLNLANDQLYAHQLAMLDVVYSFFNNTRTHLKHGIVDINSGNIQGAISELKMVDNLLRGHEQGMLMMMIG